MEFCRLAEIKPFCFLDLDSTQEYLSSILRSHHEGDIVFSKIQTKGKGRENRKWYSNESGLWFSLTLKPSSSEVLRKLPIIAATDVKETLELDYSLKGCEIKLPNDVLCKGKKIAGVLVDGEITGEHTLAYLGIGVNLNNDPRQNLEIEKISTSYILETGLRINIEDFLLKFLQRFDRSYFILNQL